MPNYFVAISLGNKMNFSLYVNMAGFCSDSHICTMNANKPEKQEQVLKTSVYCR